MSVFGDAGVQVLNASGWSASGEAIRAGSLGVRLRRLRLAQGLTLRQVEAGSRGAVKAGTIGAYERGARQMTVPRLAQLCALYGGNVNSIIAGPSPSARTPDSVLQLRMAVVRTGVLGAPLRRWATGVLAERHTLTATVIDLDPSDQLAVAAMVGVWAQHLEEHLEAFGALVPASTLRH